MAEHEPRIPGEPTSADAGGEETATLRGKARHADATGAALVAIAVLGGVAWAWEFMRTQFVASSPGSLSDRLDLLVAQTPLLLLSGVAAGVGVGLRTLSGVRTDASTRSALGHPVRRILLGVATALVVLVGAAVVVGSDDDNTFGVEALDVDELGIDYSVPVAPPGSSLTRLLPELTHSLEVDSDGCGVYRSGEIGDDLAWVVKDQDGFRVLGRKAAGETQFRYFRPGTYSVVLETWGGSYYVDVSNEVMITC